MENISISQQVRKIIPEILKSYGKEGLSFNQLFEKMLEREEVKEELLDEYGNRRIGVLRGIVNRLDSIPIKNVSYEKRGSNMVFIYNKNALEELQRLSKNFIYDIREKGLTTVDIFLLSEEELELYKKYQQVILELNKITENKDRN